MNILKKTGTIIVVILLIPVLFYFLKPEIDLENKFLKFSWNKSYQELEKAIKNKNPGQVVNSIYGNFLNRFTVSRIESKVKKTYTSYSLYTKNTMNKFLKKWKNFIALPEKTA